MTDVPDMNELLRQAVAMRDQLAAAQEEASERTVEGSAGGGLVRVTMSGGGDVVAVAIEPEAVDPDDVEMLEDLVLAALRDALHQLQDLQAAALGGLDLGGLDLAGLGMESRPELEGPAGGDS